MLWERFQTRAFLVEFLILLSEAKGFMRECIQRVSVFDYYPKMEFLTKVCKRKVFQMIPFFFLCRILQQWKKQKSLMNFFYAFSFSMYFFLLFTSILFVFLAVPHLCQFYGLSQNHSAKHVYIKCVKQALLKSDSDCLRNDSVHKRTTLMEFFERILQYDKLSIWLSFKFHFNTTSRSPLLDKPNTCSNCHLPLGRGCSWLSTIYSAL